MQLFRARYLLPVGAPLIEDGALLVEGGRIVAVGPYPDLAAAHPGAAAVDFGESVILPPLVNAHTHLELSHFPLWAQAAGETAEPATFVDWILRLVRVRRSVDQPAVRAALADGLRQSLAAGTGAVGDILTTLPLADAYAAAPLAGRVFAEILGVDALRVAGRLADIAAKLDAPPGPALTWGLSPHAPYTLSHETLSLALTCARDHGLPLAIHWGETAAELEFLAKGEGEIKRLYAAAGWTAPSGAEGVAAMAFPAGTLLIHGVHLRTGQVEALARTGQAVVLCPRSNSRFGDTRAPVAALRRAGVPLALGTDSLASSPSLSVWDELAFARSWFAGDLEPSAWLEIATAGGAAALGLRGGAGRLAAGGTASFQAVAVPAGASAASLCEALCAGGDAVKVAALYLRGENILPLS